MSEQSPQVEWIGATAAARLLGVKPATLYSYASRRLVRSEPDPSGRRRQYHRGDLERLRARHDARSGHGPVAAGALRWGEPVLDSAITEITLEGPKYRGHLAVALARDGVAFESVAELLWTGQLPQQTPRWPSVSWGLAARKLSALVPPDAHPLSRLAVVLSTLAVQDASRFGASASADVERMHSVLPRLAAGLSLGGTVENGDRALEEPNLPRALCSALGVRVTPMRERALKAALVLCADHELNASTFAARIAASAGADLYACLSAALATLSGPKHGGASDRVEALLSEIPSSDRASETLQRRAQRGEEIPGLGHALYPHGDPRAPLLLELASALAPRAPGVGKLRAMVEAMRRAGREGPTLDLGLVAVADAAGLPPHSASVLFALGRCAGWLAHVLEQKAAGFMLRPRARYVGVESAPRAP